MIEAERVAEKAAAARENAGDLGDDLAVVGLGQEVTEAGEEVDDGAKVGVRKRQPAHVAADQAKAGVAVPCERQLRRRVVEADRTDPRLRKAQGVAAGAAAEVEQGRDAFARQLVEGERRLAPRRGEIPVRIEVEVLLAEPVLPPRHRGARL